MLKKLLLLLSLAWLFTACTVPPAQSAACLPVKTIIQNLLDNGNYADIALLNPTQAERYILAFLTELPSDWVTIEILVARDIRSGMYTLEAIRDGIGCADIWVSTPEQFQHGMEAAVGQPI